jgi:hypothetical protein
MSENNWKSRWSRDEIKAMLLEQFQAFWQRDTGMEAVSENGPRITIRSLAEWLLEN